MDRVSVPFLVKISDKRRKVVDSQKKKNYVYRKTSLLEQIIFNVVPVLTTSTILAPLNRIKILLQVNKTLVLKDATAKSLYKEILSDQGFIGLWKGNIASTLRILAQLSSRIILYDRIKYYFNKKKRVHTQTKFNIPVLSYAFTILSASFSSLACMIISYPFDLAHARITSDLTNKKKHDNITFMKAFITVSNPEASKYESRFNFIKYYKGCSLASISIVPNFIITMIGYEFYSKIGKRKGNTNISNPFKNFAISSFVSLIASTVTYPIDTMKRLVQVAGTYRYITEFFSNAHVYYKVQSQGYLNFYNGFSFHVMRNLPFAYIQYNIFLLIGGLHKKLKKDHKDIKIETN